MPRPRQARPPQARARLERFARDYERRERQQAEARAKLRAQRDEAIRRAYRDGLPIRDIAAIVDLSHQHISRIARS
jgi:hypothetical protein